MSLIENKDDSPEKWKKKYFDLLDSQELRDKASQANEDLLCKTIVRFALAVKGLNKELDPHLDNIRNSLKRGLKNQQLQDELEAFSKALMLLEEAPENQHVDASLLFEFLGRQYPGHKIQLELMRKKYERGELGSGRNLLDDLSELVADEDEGGADLAVADSKAVNLQLIRLLEYAEIPEPFAEQANEIKARLQAEDGVPSLAAILNDTVTLLLDVKKHLKQEQQDMAVFLSRLTEQLAELGLKATGVDVAHEKAIKRRNLLDQTVSREMADLQKKSACATQLEPLKQLVHSRLESIGQQIQEYNQQERIEREEAQRKLRELAERVREMEAESSELKSKLDIAQRKATRDPLTLLPNRLALEDRLNDELSRWRRHGTVLSMVLWDIDFFKKINDTYGHKSGDKALIVIAQLLSKFCRQSDFVARIGGEEFVMLLPETDAQNALRVANKLRQTVEQANFKVNENRITITVSCGISQLVEGDDNESIFERADKALYQAKQSGRNQCIVI